MSRTIVFFPEGAFGPTNNCVGIGEVLRERGHRVVFIIEESFAGTLEARGFEERLMRLGAAARGRGGAGPVLEGLHPRHGARVPKAHLRAALELHPAHLAGADRRRPLRQPAADRDHRRAAAGRDLRGQRGRLPGARRLRPCRGCASSRATRPSSPTRRCRRSSPACPPATARSGRVSRRVRAQPPAAWSEFDAFVREAGALRPARPGVHPPLAVSEPVPVPRGGRLPAPAAAGRRTGSASSRASAATTPAAGRHRPSWPATAH